MFNLIKIKRKFLLQKLTAQTLRKICKYGHGKGAKSNVYFFK